MLYVFFLLSMVIVGLVFLMTNISDNRDAIPNFNTTMYNFLFVGLWIIVALASLDVLFTLGGIGYMVTHMAVLPTHQLAVCPAKAANAPVRKKPKRTLAQQANRVRSRSR